MSSKLLLRLTEADDRQFEWVSVDTETSSTIYGSGNEADIQALSLASHVTLVFPTSRVSFSRFNIPTRNPQQVTMAVRSMIEERLANDVDDMHILFEQSADGEVEVAAIQRDYLANLLGRLDEYGLKPDVVTPDCFLLPYTQNGWTVYDSGQGLLIRSGKFSGFAYDHDWLDRLGYEHILDIAKDKPTSLTIYHHGDAPRFDFQQIPVENQQCVQMDDRRGLLDLALQHNDFGVTSNFLSGEFAPQQSSQHAWINWHLPVYALAASLVVISVFVLIQNWVYQGQLNDLQQQADTIFSDTFPDAEPIHDLGDEAYRLQFQRQIDQQVNRNRQHEHPELVSLYNVLAQIKKHSGASLLNLSYSSDAYVIDVQFPGLSVSNEFINDVNRAGTFRAKALPSPAGADGSQSRIQIVKKGSA